MENARFDYGSASSIDAEAVGRPGQRRFRLLVRSGSGAAAVWMEKEQLAGIGAWFTQENERLDREEPSSDPDVEPSPFPLNFDLDFRASQIALGFDGREGQFAIQAYDIESGAEKPHFACRVSRGQARVLSRKIEAVVNAGRQICPLCQQPMDPAGHACPRTNGHSATGRPVGKGAGPNN